MGGEPVDRSSPRGRPPQFAGLPRFIRSLLVLLALVAGATLVAVGVGLAPHLAQEGLSATSVLGLLAAAAGVALLTLTVRSVWRSRRVLAGVVVVPAAIVLVVTAALTLGQAVAATAAPHVPLGDRTPASVGLRYEDVMATTGDGVPLAGWYVPSRNGAAVVLCHGAGSTRSDVLDHAAALAGQGLGVLMIDARGHGGSGGRPMEFGWYGDLDLRAAVDVLVSRPDVTDGRVAVVGLSMGGEEAIGALASDDRIAAVVAEGATNRVAGDKLWLGEEVGLRGWLQEQLDRLTYGATDLLTPASPPPTLRASAAAAAPRPLLLVAAGESFEEAGAARYIASASPGSVTVWLAPGGHTGALAADRDQWQQQVGTFLAAALGTAL